MTNTEELKEGTIVRLIGNSDRVNELREIMGFPKRDWNPCFGKDLYILKQDSIYLGIRLYRLEGSGIMLDGRNTGLWELLVPETAFSVKL